VNRGQPPDLRDLRALRDKYERMLALRALHHRARFGPDQDFEEPDPRPEMAKLADTFPGVLREIDRLPLAVITRRIEAIVAAEASGRVERWMIAQVVFHRHARAALTIKRWLAGTKAITPELQAAFDAWASPEEQLFADALGTIATPPRGRLMDVVHERVALVLEVTAGEVRSLVFGTD
jgi:hypothetical protein